MSRNLRYGSGDELLAPRLHRPIAERIARVLTRTAITPTVVTGCAFTLTVGAAGLFWVADEPALTIMAGLTLFVATILDCVDGALARSRGAEGEAGAWLDTMLDRIGDTAIVIAITAHQAGTTSGSWPWLIGMSAIAATTVASYGRKEYELRFGMPMPPMLATRLARRDVTTTILVLGAFALVPFAALAASAVIGLAALLAMFAAVVMHRSHDRQ